MPHVCKPTAEQHAVVDAVLRGVDLKVKAYAGAGKTSTLLLVADRFAGKRGSYLAFKGNCRVRPTRLSAKCQRAQCIRSHMHP